MERRVEVRRHTEAGEVSRWIPLAKNSLRPYLPSKDHTLTYNRALGGVRSSADIDKLGSFGDKEADGSFLAECTRMIHGYYNPTAERSPRRRTFDVLDNRSDSISSSGKVKWLPIIARNSVTASSNYRSDSYIPLEEESLYRSTLVSSKQPSSGRSMSADVSYFRRDSSSRWNERCVNFGEQSRGLISYRWMPETGISMSRYIPSPLVHRRTSEGDRLAAKPLAGTRWMSYAKNPSPSPIQRKLSDRRSSGSEQPATVAESAEGATEEPAKSEEAKSARDEDRPAKREEVSGWQPVRKFADAGQQQKPGPQARSTSGEQDPSVPDDNRVKQRLRELYDFKTETEWPKRVRNPFRETLWISKSSSEEDKSQHFPLTHQLSNAVQQTSKLPEKKPEPLQKAHPVRRNSQDLEFNDRTPSTSGSIARPPTPSITIQHHRPKQQRSDSPLLQRQPSFTRRQLPERPTYRRESSSDQVFELTKVEDRQLRSFRERLRFSEDHCRTDEEKEAGSFTKVHERRFFSDDYENPSRRKISDSMLVLRANKRNSDSSFRSSRPSYAEIESVSSTGATRSSRTASDASYVSVGSSSVYNPQTTKRGSIEFRESGRRLDISHRRAMSQYEPRPRTMMSQMEGCRVSRTASHYEHRPRTPVPPPEIEDLYKDFRVPGKSSGGFPSRQRRNSTRYKVYLT
ncbi:uncharacterized protein LOC100116601 isoform X1 [Nasonia vitripennis]|uniref:Uncharacterized protein n=1 Tax=Nasonia vitripennis TaxID=7425 RepID=A0A7M7T9X9_NASVI|nr:uncharacterized protein LOC100116601 isoform X1 [Nasonia vitripennis]